MTGRSKLAICLVVWGLTAVGFFLVGRGFNTWRARTTPQDLGSPVSATPLALPPSQFIAATGADKKGCQVNIFRRVPDLRICTGVSVFNGEYPIVYVTFHEGSGNLKKIEAIRARGDHREWSFREDGSIEYGPIFDRKAKGNRQYYDVEGNPTEQVTVGVSHGS
jgi:hypothetical protein